MLRGLQGGNGGILSLTPYGEVPWYCHATDQRGGSRGGGGGVGYLCGVLSADPEVIGIPCGRISDKVKHPRETAGALHVSTLEGGGVNFIGGTVTTTEV